jgi:hypothetical protein
MNSKLDIFLIPQFLSIYNLSKQDLSKPHNKFRYLLFKFTFFIKPIVLPSFKKNQINESVLIEFRKFPHLEFLIRNTILKLGVDWSHTIVCGNQNYDMIFKIAESISKNINIIKLNFDNLSQSEYSELLTKDSFWNMFYGEKLLIYQEDTILFDNINNTFLNVDYIGAPFSKNSNDTPNKVGNGGFSLRSKSKMIEVIKRLKINEMSINSTTQSYMKYRNLASPPEDVYFSKTLQEFNIGDVGSYQLASLFSSEQTFNPKAIGAHKIWIGTNKWKQHIVNKFNYSIYRVNSDLDLYLSVLKKPGFFNLTSKIKNAFDIDLFFYSKANSLPYNNKKDVLNHLIRNGLHGFIYHPKQILNIFSNCEFYIYSEYIYVFLKNRIYLLSDFIDKFIYNNPISNLISNSIKKKKDTLNDNFDLIIYCFIGNLEVGINLINNIINYKKKQPEFNLAICIHKDLCKNKEFKNLIINNFDFYAIYISREFGNDITPTLFMNHLIRQKHSFKYIIKVHTKTDKNIFDQSTDYLLSKSLIELNGLSNINSNC